MVLTVDHPPEVHRAVWTWTAVRVHHLANDVSGTGHAKFDVGEIHACFDGEDDWVGTDEVARRIRV